MLGIDWTSVGLFMASMLAAALAGLSASGHFPSELRAAKFKGAIGSLVLWGAMIATAVAVLASLASAWRTLPWYALVIGGGAALLFAPLVLRLFPDSLVNGRRGLIGFAGACGLCAWLLWRQT